MQCIHVLCLCWIVLANIQATPLKQTDVQVIPRLDGDIPAETIPEEDSSVQVQAEAGLSIDLRRPLMRSETSDTRDPDHCHVPPCDDEEDDSHSMSHPMWFHASAHATILFEKWHTMTWGDMLGACFGVGAFAMLFEGFKVFREWLLQKYSSRGKIKRRCPCRLVSITPIGCDNKAPVDCDKDSKADMNAAEFEQPQAPKWYALKDIWHIIQSLLQIIHIFLGMCLMLIFMTFNCWLCLSICLGSGLGYYLFNWIKPHVGDKNDCCE